MFRLIAMQAFRRHINRPMRDLVAALVDSINTSGHTLQKHMPTLYKKLTTFYQYSIAQLAGQLHQSSIQIAACHQRYVT